MKQQIIISTTFFTVGFSIVLLYLLSVSSTKEEPLFGLLGIGLVSFSLGYSLARLHPKNISRSKTISSRATPIYKFIIPLSFFILFLFNTLLILLKKYPGDDVSIFMTIEIMIAIWVILFIPYMKLSVVSIDNNRLIASNFHNELIFQISDMKKINRCFLFLYRIHFIRGKSKKSIVFLPRFTESSNVFATPRSVKILKCLITH